MRSGLFLDDACSRPGGLTDVVSILLLLRALLEGLAKLFVDLKRVTHIPQLRERFCHVETADGCLAVCVEAFGSQVDRGHTSELRPEVESGVVDGRSQAPEDIAISMQAQHASPNLPTL